MRNFTLISACLMGFVLVAGGWFFPNNIIMWFASSSDTMHVLRPAVLAGILVLALLHSYYDSAYLRMIWGLASVGLVWGGIAYFVDNAEFIFDAMYIVLAGICFAIAALRPADEPLSVPLSVDVLRSRLAMAYYSRPRKPRLQFTYTWQATDLKDISHRLTLKSGPQLLKQ